MGSDLIKFVKSISTNKYFSAQIIKQIEIGLEIADLAKEEIDASESFEVMRKLINQCLNRDEGWKEYYISEMNKIIEESKMPKIYNILHLERNAEENFYKSNYQEAIDIVQNIINNYCNTDSELGWYLQILARYKYYISQIESNRTQKSAFEKNMYLLKPKEGVNYKMLEFINENRIRRVKKWLKDFNSYEELMLQLVHLLDDLSFGIPHEKFENSLQEIGYALGFLSQRPDKEYKEGPDNLWCGINNEYIVFECNSEVEDTRQDIKLNEVGQMNTHCAWFEEKYGDAKVKYILIIPTKNVTSEGTFSHPIEIMRKGKLKLLKSKIKSFYKELIQYKIHELSDEKINELLKFYELDIQSLNTKYSERYFRKR